MKQQLEVKDICQAIWQVEEKFDLLKFRIEGIPVWQFTRMMVYYELARRTAVLTGCAVYLLRLPGVEYMSKLIDAGHIHYFEDCVSAFAQTLPKAG